jgi:hypothetical protein
VVVSEEGMEPVTVTIVLAIATALCCSGLTRWCIGVFRMEEAEARRRALTRQRGPAHGAWRS